VGNGEEQNGSGKIALKAGKKDLLDKKDDLGLPLVIEKYDIVVLMKRAWDTYFASIECSKNTICNRGWSPLNRALLHPPELQVEATREEEQAITATSMRTFNAGLEQVNPSSLKLVDRHVGTIVNCVANHVNHVWATNGTDAEATMNKN
jgi:hypothetical protein